MRNGILAAGLSDGRARLRLSLLPKRRLQSRTDEDPPHRLPRRRSEWAAVLSINGTSAKSSTNVRGVAPKRCFMSRNPSRANKENMAIPSWRPFRDWRIIPLWQVSKIVV